MSNLHSAAPSANATPDFTDFARLKTAFQTATGWEARFRLLLQLSKAQTKPDEAELASYEAIPGCESRVWFHLDESGAKGFAEARLTLGLIAFICLAINAEAPETRASLDLAELLQACGIAGQLSETRLAAIREIQHRLVTFSA